MATAKITLPLGRTFTMAQSVSYAIPVGQVLIRVQGAGALELSNDDSSFLAATTTNNQVLTAARFAQTTTGTLIVSLQRA